MKRFRNEVIFKEFPFLEKWEEEDEEQNYPIAEADISVKRLDEELLKNSVEEHYHDGSLVDYRDMIRVIGVLDNGSFVEDYKNAWDSQSNYGYEEPASYEGETLLEWIDRKSISKSLKYIIIHRYGKDYIYGNRDESWNYLTIYKLPKGKSIMDIISKVKDEVAQQVKREISF